MKKQEQLRFSICIPLYKGSHLLKRLLKNILNQSFENYEIIIADDNKPEWEKEIQKTQNIIASFKNRKIRYIKNEKNLGCQQNIKKLASLAKNDILFYIAQDDLLSHDALRKTHDAFFLDEDIGAVTRPYFWFEHDYHKPVRAVLPPNPNKDTAISLSEGKKAVTAIFGSVGQVSGLAYRKKYIDIPFHEDIFPGHIYPFAGIAKKHTVVFLKDYTVAVSIPESQTRHLSSIYDASPTESWIRMFQAVFKEKKYRSIRALCIEHIATHYEGLVQIKNYGKTSSLYKEIVVLIRYHWKSLLNPRFWFYVFLTVFAPRKLLIALTDYYKRNILSKTLPKIEFKPF